MCLRKQRCWSDHTLEALVPRQKPNKGIVVAVKQKKHHIGTRELGSSPRCHALAVWHGQIYSLSATKCPNFKMGTTISMRQQMGKHFVHANVLNKHAANS